MQHTRSLAVRHCEKLIGVPPTLERHGEESPSCPCGPYLDLSLESPVLVHRPWAFANLSVPDAWPSPGRVA